MVATQEELIEKITNYGLKPPEMLTLMITQGCNLECPHCLLECKPANQTRPVQTDIIKRIIDDFSRLGGSAICLTGGDPLLHPNWMEILSYACGFDIFHEVCMQTNATLITENYVKNFLSLPQDKFVLQISLDGADPETHDRLRGQGRFKSTLKALQLLSETGLGKQTRIVFTEMSHNYDELPRVIELVSDLGLQGLVSGSLVKSGRSLNSDWIGLPNVSQVISLVERYQRDRAFRDHYEKLGKISAIEWFKGRDFESDQVCTCIKNPFISAHGRLYPCVMYLNDSLSVDGIYEQSLGSAIIEMLPKWDELPSISRDRIANLEICQDCPGKFHCGGGCLGRADAVHGDVMSVEDRCELRKAVYRFKP